MTIATFADLQTSISDNLARSDLTAFVPDFITLAENWLNYGSENVSPLRCREMEIVVSLVPASGVCTVPSDYLQYQRVTELAGTRRPLAYITPDMAEVLYPTRAAGLGSHFSIIGSSLYTFPLVANNVELTYYQAIPALSVSNTTNWLLTKAPGVYLRAALIQAAAFIHDDAELTKQAQLAKALIAGLNHSDMMGKFARAGIVTRTITP